MVDVSDFPQPFAHQYRLHLQHLRLKGLQPKTIDAYARGMRRIGEYFSYRVDDLGEADMVGYFTALKAQHSWSGVKLDLYAWKFFTEHVLGKPWVVPNFIRPPKVSRLPDIVSVGQVQALLDATRVLSYRVFFFTLYSLDAKLAATPGAVGVLHTHSRRLDFHPHVHMVMPAAALDAARGLWRTKCRRTRRRRAAGDAQPANSPSGGYLFNHKALAKVFRAKLLDAIQAAGLTLPDQLPATWVVDCKAVGDGSKALLYLGRYLYRGVVQEGDILSCQDGQVTFRYRDAKTGKAALRTLPGADFLWLVLQHVLPKGMRRARNFGFLHPNSAGAVRLLQVLHLRPTRPLAEPAAMPTRPAWRCACGQPMVVLRRRMPAQAQDGDPAVHDKPDKAGPMEGHATH